MTLRCSSACKLNTLTDCRESLTFSWDGPEKLTGPHDPRHVLQTTGGLADLWYMDDGDTLCHPILVPTYMLEFDVANAKVGAERNPLKTEVISYVNDLNAASPEWRIRDVQNVTKVSTAIARSIPLGVHVGPRHFIADQLLAKADVIRAMHERVQLCQDLQMEFALFRESLGVSRIDHNLRAHDHTILQEQRAAEIYDVVGQRFLERLFPGFTEDSMTQATLSAGQSGIGHKKSARHRRCLAAGYDDRILVPHARLPQVALSLGRLWRHHTPDATRLHHQCAGQTWKQVRAACAAPSWTHSWNMARPAAPPKPCEDTTHAFTLWFAV